MDLTPKDIERMKSTREEVKNALDSMLELVDTGMLASQRRVDCLKDILSKYPATRDFLRARGLEHVSELDTEGMKGLNAHLKQVFAEFT